MEFVPRAQGAGAESDMWAKMPYNQLAKCAERAALAKGWPAQLGAIEIDTEGELAREEPQISYAPQQVIEQAPPAPVQRSTRTATWESTMGSADWGETEPDPKSLPPRRGVDPDNTSRIVDTETGEVLYEGDGTDEVTAAAPDPADLDPLDYNRSLLDGARSMGISATTLNRFLAGPDWPETRTVEANVALETLIKQRIEKGDKQVAAAQDVRF